MTVAEFAIAALLEGLFLLSVGFATGYQVGFGKGRSFRMRNIEQAFQVAKRELERAAQSSYRVGFRDGRTSDLTVLALPEHNEGDGEDATVLDVER